jgi:hypothetical protein
VTPYQSTTALFSWRTMFIAQRNSKPPSHRRKRENLVESVLSPADQVTCSLPGLTSAASRRTGKDKFSTRITKVGGFLDVLGQVTRNE